MANIIYKLPRFAKVFAGRRRIVEVDIATFANAAESSTAC